MEVIGITTCTSADYFDPTPLTTKRYWVVWYVHGLPANGFLPCIHPFPSDRTRGTFQ